MLDRIMGIVTLKPATYRAVADDQNATGQAAIIVVVMAVVAALIGAVVLSAFSTALPTGTAGGSTLGFIVRTILNAIIGWLVGSWVFAFVSTTFFGGKTNTSEMLRVFGFTQVFQILAIIPCLGAILALILSVIGAIIGIREASEFDTTKAILTGVVGFVILLVVSFVVALVLGAVGLA